MRCISRRSNIVSISIKDPSTKTSLPTAVAAALWLVLAIFGGGWFGSGIVVRL